MLPTCDLTDAAFLRMMLIFKQYDHKPSGDQQSALRAIQSTLSAMLMEEAGRRYYLSSLDPGVGKTTAIISWIRTYMEVFTSGSYPHGILICVDRHTEIKRYVDECGLPDRSFAVLAGKGEIHLNSLGVGSDNTNSALVLFTTKEQIRRRSQGISVDALSILHFGGRPRAVKVWDESLMVGKDIVINPYDLGRLYTPLSKVSEELVPILQGTMSEIMECEGSLYHMPMFPELPNDYFQKVKMSSRDKELLEVIWGISGQIVSVRKERGTQLIIDCVQSIPNDFPPCIILDASGRIKGTYKMQRRKLQNLEILPYSNKSYRNLTIKVWDRPGGRGITNDLKAVTPELVNIIKDHSGEDFLFLLYLDQVDPLQKSLRKHLSDEEMNRLKYCTWGQHTATNEFCNIRNVIALSAYQYPDSSYEAITRAAGMMTTEGGVFPTQEEINMVKKGEISSEFLQGVTRSAVRKSEGDTCPQSRLWLIAHPKTGLRRELPVIFPDSIISDWKTQGFLLTKKQQEVFNLIHDHVKSGARMFPCATIRHQVRMAQCSFRRMMLSDGFKAALSSIGTMIISDQGGWYFQVSL